MNRQPILLIEDNDDDAELAQMAFRAARVDNPLVRVRDGVEGLDYLFGTGEHSQRDRTLQPAVVLLDLKLPRLDGHEVLEAIRANPLTRHLPVVVLTSSAEDKDRLAAYDHCANSYVQKPVDYDQFVAAANQLGLYWTVWNKPPPSAG